MLTSTAVVRAADFNGDGRLACSRGRLTRRSYPQSDAQLPPAERTATISPT